MINRRILLNLVAFGLLFVVLSVWAVRNIITFDFIERPYEVSAEFATSPGLQPNFEVAYLGVRVGSIDSVKLQGDRVVVDLSIDRGIDIPADSSAAVRRKSAVGEPYVDLTPPGGVTPESVVGATMLADGDRIPLERTSVPLSYAELFSALDELVSAVPTHDLSVLIDELARGLEGRSGSIRRLLEGADDLTGTLASRSELLDQVTDDLTQLTHTFAENRQDFGTSVDNLALIAETLAASRQDLLAVVDGTPGFTNRVAELMAASEADLGCLLDSLGTISANLADPVVLQDLSDLLTLAAPTRDLFNDIMIEPGEDGADGPYIESGFTFNAGGVPVPDRKPPPLGQPAGRRSCGLKGTPPLEPVADASSGQGGQVGAGAGPSPAGDSEAPGPDEEGEGASSDKDVGGDDFDPPPWLLPLLLLIVLAVLYKTRPWERFGSRRAAAGPAALIEDETGAETAEIERTTEQSEDANP